jgi:hypothetical protein
MGGIGNFPLADSSRPLTLGMQQETNRRGGEMLAIDWPCGHHLEAATEYDLFRLAREHVDRDHPEMQRSDDQIRERVGADSYEV